MSLQNFLSETKAINFLLLQKILKFVIGNEASDLDSCVSAVVYAHALQTQFQDQNFSYIPILNIQRKDYVLKTEVNYWFNQVSIDASLLTFKDDLNLMHYCKNDNAEIILVDHNVPAPSDANMEPYISNVVDHHALERSSTPVYGMIVEPVGSCSTLITEYVKKHSPHLITRDVAKLLYGTIVLDTVNMDPMAKRTTEKDENMIRYLQQILDIGIPERKNIFDELRTALSDISHLSLMQILRKDQKKIAEGNFVIVFSAVHMLIQDLASIRDFQETLPSFLAQNEYDLLICMGMDVSDGVKRDILVYATKKSVLLEVSKYLETAEEAILQLESVETDLENGKAYVQRNVAASRKKVLPLVKTWLQSTKDDDGLK